MSAVTETPVVAIDTRIIRRLASVSHEHHVSFNPATLEDLSGPDTVSSSSLRHGRSAGRS